MKRFFFHIITFTALLSTTISCAKGQKVFTRNNTITNHEKSKEDIRQDYAPCTWTQDVNNMLVPVIPAILPTQFLKRKGYITSYNKETKCPNWVAWYLTREHTDGPYSRKSIPYYSEDGSVCGIGFVTQETCKNGYFVDLEAEEPRQKLSDWTRDYNMSHGHMCPAGDNKWDKVAMNQSFFLTNMCPQDESLNSGGWNKLEEKCRVWANKYGGLYIVAGPIFTNGITRTLGDGGLAVPDAFFKVILCVKGKPKAIGFIYKNDSSSHIMKECIRAVNDVEAITGFDFFSSLNDDIESAVESDSDITNWN